MTAQGDHAGGSARPALKVVPLHAKQRCPYCNSPKWKELGVDHDTPASKVGCVIRYRCIRCHEEFLVEDRGLTKMVSSADLCPHCGSTRLERDPRPDGTQNMWRCRQCRGWMVVLPFVDQLGRGG